MLGLCPGAPSSCRASGSGDGDAFSSRRGRGIDIGLGPDTVSGGRPVHKTRFVWTAELHRRFEAAVNTLDRSREAAGHLAAHELRGRGRAHPPEHQVALAEVPAADAEAGEAGPGGAAGEGAPAEGEVKKPETSGEADKASQPAEPADARRRRQHLARRGDELKVQMELQRSCTGGYSCRGSSSTSSTTRSTAGGARRRRQQRWRPSR